jgi:uncharacterized membrane protein
MSGRDLFSVSSLAISGLVAAVYTVATIMFAPISYGYIQVRIAEAFTVLPFILPQAVFGLFVGCVFANMAGGFGIIDVVLGSAATLLAGVVTSAMPNVYLAALPPVVVNMLIVGGYLSHIMGVPFPVTAFYVGIGQVVACYFLGVPLTILLEKRMKKGGDIPAR